MKEIKLTQGKVALVDDEDFERVSQYKWYTHETHRGNIYAERKEPTIKGQIGVSMHSLIMGKKQGFEIDHINHNSLDNRRANLRHVTRTQNMQNSRPYKNSTSIYKGVSFMKGCGKWLVQIKVNKKHIYCGVFISEQKAAIAYNNLAIKMFGQYAYLNTLTEGK